MLYAHAWYTITSYPLCLIFCTISSTPISSQMGTYPSNTAVWLISVHWQNLKTTKAHKCNKSPVKPFNPWKTGENDKTLPLAKFPTLIHLSSETTHWVFKTRVSVVSRLSMTSNSMFRRKMARLCLSTSLWESYSWASSVGMSSAPSWPSGFWWS